MKRLTIILRQDGESGVCTESLHCLERSGPQAPQQRAGSALSIGLISCLPVPLPRASAPWQSGVGKKPSRGLSPSTPRSLLFIPRSPSVRVLSLFLSCTACCFPSSFLPPLSAKCQSRHRMSSSASNPQRPCPRTRAATADTHRQQGVGLLAGPLIVPRSRMGAKMEFEGIASPCLPLSGHSQGRAILIEGEAFRSRFAFHFKVGPWPASAFGGAAV